MIFSPRSACFLLAVCGLLAAPFPGKADNLVEALQGGKHKVVDLSYALSNKLPAWPGDQRTFEAQVNVRADQAGYFSRSFWMLEHYGTHLDAPIHFSPGSVAVDEIPPQRLIGPAVVLDVRQTVVANPDYRITPRDVLAWEERHGRIPPGAIALARTGWAERWPDQASYPIWTTRARCAFRVFPWRPSGF